MFNFSLMGAGRIGKMHAGIINSHPECNLEYIYDINTDFVNELASKYGAKVASTPEEALTEKNIDAILIASATPTHTEFINKGSNAGKAIFCEKPIDLDIEKVDLCREAIKDTKVPIQIGFNRRFDNSHSKLQKATRDEEIGKLEMIIITSRDPEPPGLDYLKAAGGFFRDTTIHDFDLARFILGEDPIVQVSAFGSQLISDDVKKVNDHDTAMFILKSKNGVLIHINNSRRAVYGYDQRVEIFGSKGMMISNNQTPTSVQKYSKNNTESREPIHYFFIERYEQAYRDQFNDFVATIKNNKKPSVSFEDGRNALILANAAYESYNYGKVIDIKYD
jgi:myo-inositol 2-dehydrogenase / D-chiro-inositol 1-dehydrogenase